MSPLIIAFLVWLIGAFYWSWPSVQDAADELKSDQKTVAGVLERVVAILITGIFWPLFALYKIILCIPGFIERHFPAP